MFSAPSFRHFCARWEMFTEGSPGVCDSASQTPDDFVALVRDALAHLYDLAHLQCHSLTRLVTLDGRSEPDPGRTLRALLLDTLEQLKPNTQVSRNDKAWRSYDILTHRYVDGFEVEDIAEELSISIRQFQREHRKGLLATAMLLWRRWQDVGAGTVSQSAAVDSDLQEEINCLGVALTRVDLGALLHSVTRPAEALARQCGAVKLVIRVPESPIWTWADPILSRQAFLGTLGALLTARPARVHVTWARVVDEAILTCRIALALSQLDPKAASEVLARLRTVAELMHAQGGRLETDTDEQGLQALLHFRLAQNKSVFLIDDNERLLLLFRRYLVADGFVVTAASGVAQAWAALQSQRPDVVILDVMMCQADGWQFLEQLRADATLGDVPVIVCSVLNEPELAFALGAQCYLKKPVSQQQMLVALREVLGQNSPEARPPV